MLCHYAVHCCFVALLTVVVVLQISGNAKQLSKASDVLTGPGGAKDAK